MRNVVRVLIALSGGVLIAVALILMFRDSGTTEREGRTGGQEISVSGEDPAIYTITLPTGISVQGFVQPGRPGANEIHLTFLTENGTPQRVEIARFRGLPAAGDPVALEATELAPGHFVAQEDLGAGSWRFEVHGSTPEGTQMRAYFEETIEE
ncbi:MAG TPA: hypothetical protein VHI54_10060 [Actinomycetota bacterium]|nr:hypothetical protein [Actinomycetota bacterium]